MLLFLKKGWKWRSFVHIFMSVRRQRTIRFSSVVNRSVGGVSARKDSLDLKVRPRVAGERSLCKARDEVVMWNRPIILEEVVTKAKLVNRQWQVTVGWFESMDHNGMEKRIRWIKPSAFCRLVKNGH